MSQYGGRVVLWVTHPSRLASLALDTTWPHALPTDAVNVPQLGPIIAEDTQTASCRTPNALVGALPGQEPYEAFTCSHGLTMGPGIIPGSAGNLDASLTYGVPYPASSAPQAVTARIASAAHNCQVHSRFHLPSGYAQTTCHTSRCSVMVPGARRWSPHRHEGRYRR
jgi:hypothetical protein